MGAEDVEITDPLPAKDGDSEIDEALREEDAAGDPGEADSGDDVLEQDSDALDTERRSDHGAAVGRIGEALDRPLDGQAVRRLYEQMEPRL